MIVIINVWNVLHLLFAASILLCAMGPPEREGCSEPLLEEPKCQS